jgi:predicted nucleic acid-binding protein
LVVAGRQKITRDWWRYALNAFDLVVSELVHREASAGDPQAIRRRSAGDPQAIRDRLEALKGIRVLAITERAEDFARALVAGGAVPSTEREDSLHIALAVVNGVEYLVTWNFKHIANAAMRSKIHGVCIAKGYDPCTICTPEELLEPEGDV